MHSNLERRGLESVTQSIHFRKKACDKQRWRCSSRVGHGMEDAGVWDYSHFARLVLQDEALGMGGCV
ncbi:hypothetical protein VTK26DRAFT_7635 [Humicola hyalothermophila]